MQMKYVGEEIVWPLFCHPVDIKWENLPEKPFFYIKTLFHLEIFLPGKVSCDLERQIVNCVILFFWNKGSEGVSCNFNI